MKTTELMSFDILEDCLKTAHGELFFYKLSPPNTSILSPWETRDFIRLFNEFLRAKPSVPVNIYIADCTEDLSKNRKFWADLSPQHDYISEAINAELSKENGSSGGTQRGFFIIATIKNDSDKKLFDAALRECGMLFEPLKKPDIVNVLRGFLLRDFNEYPIEVIEAEIEQAYALEKKKPDYKEYRLTQLHKRLFPSALSFKPTLIEQSDFLRQAILVKNLPLSFEAQCLLKRIAQVKDTTIQIRISDMNKYTAVSLIDKQLRNALTDVAHQKGTKQLDAGAQRNETESFYKKFSSDKDKIFYVNIYIECYGKTVEELTSKRTEVSNSLDRCTYELLNYEQKDGFLGVAPFGEDKLAMLANNVPAISLSAMFPFSYSNRTDEKGFPLGRTFDGGLFLLDFMLRNDMLTNGNFIVTGESGMGKSWLMKKIMTFWNLKAYVGDADNGIFSFDYENEYGDLCTALGGTNINAIDSRYLLNPLEIRALRTGVDDDYVEGDDNEAFKHRTHFQQHLSWLKEFIPYLIPYITGKELALLMATIKDTYYFKGITEETDLSKLNSKDFIVFSDVHEFIKKVIHDKDNYEFYKLFETKMLANLLLMLDDVVSGSLSPMFNGYTNLPNATRLNINIQELAMGDKNRTNAYLYNMMTYMWSCIIKRDRAYLMLVDELHLLCTKESLQSLQFLRSIVKRIRKYGSILGTGTQQLGDVAAPEFYTYTSALFNAPAIKFMFYPGKLDYNIYKQLANLSQSELDIMAELPKRECLAIVGKSKYRLKVGKLAYEEALFGSGGGR